MPIYNKKEFSKIVAFGNSYSDNGEANRISKYVMQKQNTNEDVYIKPGNDLYWNNRYSNGYTSVELLAKMLKIDLFNFATGGATSGRTNYTSWMDTYEETGVLGQIDRYIKNLDKGKADADALHFIFPFENDYFKFVDYNSKETIKSICKAAIENLVNGIKNLTSYGAKKFFVVSCSDLTLVPYENTMDRIKYAKEFTHTINNNLQKTITSLTEESEIEILLFNHTEVSKYISNHPEKFSFTKYKEACQVTYPKSLHVKDNHEKFYFWDEWHFSSTTHEIFAKEMYKKIISNKG